MPGGFGARPDALPDANPPLFPGVGTGSVVCWTETEVHTIHTFYIQQFNLEPTPTRALSVLSVGVSSLDIRQWPNGITVSPQNTATTSATNPSSSNNSQWIEAYLQQLQQPPAADESTARPLTTQSPTVSNTSLAPIIRCWYLSSKISKISAKPACSDHSVRL